MYFYHFQLEFKLKLYLIFKDFNLFLLILKKLVMMNQQNINFQVYLILLDYILIIFLLNLNN